jgi:hypothetical protein
MAGLLQGYRASAVLTAIISGPVTIAGPLGHWA